jgi:hypothetical protein
MRKAEISDAIENRPYDNINCSSALLDELRPCQYHLERIPQVRKEMEAENAVASAFQR